MNKVQLDFSRGAKRKMHLHECSATENVDVELVNVL